MEPSEIRLRLVEAAAKNPLPHKDGFAASVLESAQRWEQYVLNSGNAGPAAPGKGTLGLPKK